MKISILFVLLFSTNIYAQKVIGRMYFKNFLGHVHKNPSRDSTSLTTVQCSHSVKVLDEKNLISGWMKVIVGEDKGYIQTKFLTEKRPHCLQAKYPKFYNSLELDITEMYFWGRLYDHYNQVKTRVK